MYLVSFNSKISTNSPLYVHLRTYNISANGSIKYTGNELVLQDYASSGNPLEPNRPSQIKITDHLCTIAYWTPSGGGMLKTLNISSNGKITCIKTSTNALWYEPCLVYVTGEVYALAYRNASNKGIIKTFYLTSTGEIIYTGQKVVFDTISGYEPCMVQISRKVFTVVYRNNLNKGIVKTLNISSNGSIVLTGKTMIFEPVKCFSPYIVHGVDDIFIIAYATSATVESAKGNIVTLIIETGGSINPINNPQKQFDLVACGYPIIIEVTDELYAISYTGHGAHPGILITMLIGPHGQGIYKGDSYQLYANMTTVEGRINNEIVTYSHLSPNMWYHFAVTYDRMNITLYVHDVNGSLINKTSRYYPFHRIDLTIAPLYFGRFYCGYIDEIAIYDKALTPTQISNHAQTPGIFE
jgi:Concanavalin A-like lectin/glucanases superfamily